VLTFADLADLEARGRAHAAEFPSALDDASAEVGEDDLASQAVATRGAGYEDAILICKADRRAVDLELDRVAGGGDVVARDANKPLFPRLELFVVEGVSQRQHRLDVGVFCKLALRGGADPHRRRIGGSQLGMFCFDLLELTKELIVLTVRERRPVENVVLVQRPVKYLPQLRRSRFRIAGRRG